MHLIGRMRSNSAGRVHARVQWSCIGEIRTISYVIDHAIPGIAVCPGTQGELSSIRTYAEGPTWEAIRPFSSAFLVSATGYKTEFSRSPSCKACLGYSP
jgi:hypothetical protein